MHHLFCGLIEVAEHGFRLPSAKEVENNDIGGKHLHIEGPLRYLYTRLYSALQDDKRRRVSTVRFLGRHCTYENLWAIPSVKWSWTTLVYTLGVHPSSRALSGTSRRSQTIIRTYTEHPVLLYTLVLVHSNTIIIFSFTSTIPFTSSTISHT